MLSCARAPKNSGEYLRKPKQTEGVAPINDKDLQLFITWCKEQHVGSRSVGGWDGDSSPANVVNRRCPEASADTGTEEAAWWWRYKVGRIVMQSLMLCCVDTGLSGVFGRHNRPEASWFEDFFKSEGVEGDSRIGFTWTGAAVYSWWNIKSGWLAALTGENARNRGKYTFSPGQCFFDLIWFLHPLVWLCSLGDDKAKRTEYHLGPLPKILDVYADRKWVRVLTSLLDRT